MSDDGAGAVPLAAHELDAAARQYQVYVEKAEEIFTRRGQAHQFYMSLNTAIVGGITTIVGASYLGFEGVESLNLSAIAPVFGVLCVLGALICWNWFRVLGAYSKVLSGKYPQIHAMEKRMPFAPFDGEWQKMSGDKWLKGPGISIVERRLPLTFIGFYILVAAVSFSAPYWGPRLAEMLAAAG